jgi:hypothetical protein
MEEIEAAGNATGNNQLLSPKFETIISHVSTLVSRL